MDKKFDTFSFCQSDYTVNGKVDFDEMYKDIGQFVRIAIKNGYMLKMWYDGFTVVIEYNYGDQSIADVTLEWLGEDEYIESCKEDGDE